MKCSRVGWGPDSGEVCGLGLAFVGGSPNFTVLQHMPGSTPKSDSCVHLSYHPLSGVEVALPFGDGQTFPFSFLFILVHIRKQILYVASLGF